MYKMYTEFHIFFANVQCYLDEYILPKHQNSLKQLKNTNSAGITSALGFRPNKIRIEVRIFQKWN